MHKRFGLVIGLLLASVATIAQDPPAASGAMTGADTPAPASESFSTATVEQVLNTFRNAVVGTNSRRTLRLFDRDRMPDYDGFADHIGTMYQLYQNFRVRYFILQVADDKCQAIVDFTVEAAPVSDPASNNQLPLVRHSAQLRFAFARSGKEWKIVDVQPRDLFSKF